MSIINVIKQRFDTRELKDQQRFDIARVTEDRKRTVMHGTSTISEPVLREGMRWKKLAEVMDARATMHREAAPYTTTPMVIDRAHLAIEIFERGGGARSQPVPSLVQQLLYNEADLQKLCKRVSA